MGRSRKSLELAIEVEEWCSGSRGQVEVKVSGPSPLDWGEAGGWLACVCGGHWWWCEADVVSG